METDQDLTVTRHRVFREELQLLRSDEAVAAAERDTAP